MKDAKKAAYIAQYKREKIRRVPFEMQIAEYDKLKSAADAAGESVNGYIKRAIAERMAKEEELDER